MPQRSYQAISFDLPPSALLKAAGVDLHQYFGLWCVEPTSFLQMMQSLEDYNLLRHVETAHFDGTVDAARSAIAVTDASGLEAEDDDDRQRDSSVKIAVLSLSGMMTKRGRSLSSAGSSVRLRRSLRQAARDSSIDAILLKVDSPGGTVDASSLPRDRPSSHALMVILATSRSGIPTLRACTTTYSITPTWSVREHPTLTSCTSAAMMLLSW